MGELVEVLGGNAWSSASYDDAGEYLVVTIANVKGDVYIDDSLGNHINIDGNKDYVLSEDDMLISLTGNVGRVSRMTRSKAVLNQRVGKITPKQEADDLYLFTVLRTPEFTNCMIASGQGAAQMNISNNDVKSYELMVPSLSEQQAIGSFFTNLDSLITLHQRELDVLKNIKQALLEKMFV